MGWWERYQAWQLESRARYVATSLGLSLLIVLGSAWVIGGTHPGKAPLLFSIFLVLAILVYGWIYYPRAKAKSENASVPPRTSHS